MLLRVLLAFAVGLTVLQVQASAPKEAKVQELIGLHDLRTSLSIGDLYFKQTSLTAARSLLRRIGKEQGLGSDWNSSNEHWRQAEAALTAPLLTDVGREFHDLSWLASQWAEINAREFNDNDLDTLLAHFKTEMGRKQVQIVDHTVSVYVMGALSFTGKLRDDVPGTEDERAMMQKLYDEEDRAMRFNFRDNPDAQQFAVSSLGRKYFVNVLQRITGLINARIDSLAKEIGGTIETKTDHVRPMIEKYRQARAG